MQTHDIINDTHRLYTYPQQQSKLPCNFKNSVMLCCHIENAGARFHHNVFNQHQFRSFGDISKFLLRHAKLTDIF